MAVNVGDVVKCVAKMQDTNGSLIENVYFFKHNGTAAVSNTAFLTAVEAEISALMAYIQGYIPNSCTPVSIACDAVIFYEGKMTVLRTIGEVPWSTWGGGTATGAGLPQGCAAVVNFPTETPGVVGRKFFGVLTEGAQDGGSLLTAVQTALGTLIVDYLAGFLTGSEQFDPVVMSTKMSAAVALVSGIVNAVVGYQRRRKAGVGV